MADKKIKLKSGQRQRLWKLQGGRCAHCGRHEWRLGANLQAHRVADEEGYLLLCPWCLEEAPGKTREELEYKPGAAVPEPEPIEGDEHYRILAPANPMVLRILPDLATEIGLNESIILLQVSYWIEHATEGGKPLIREGRRCTYQSVRDMQQKAFRWWGKSTIARAIEHLWELELLFVGDFNEHKYDTTQWFALNPAGFRRLKSVELQKIRTTHGTGLSQNGTGVSQVGTPIPIDFLIEEKERAGTPTSGTGTAPDDEIADKDIEPEEDTCGIDFVTPAPAEPRTPEDVRRGVVQAIAAFEQSEGQDAGVAAPTASTAETPIVEAWCRREGIELTQRERMTWERAIRDGVNAAIQVDGLDAATRARAWDVLLDPANHEWGWRTLSSPFADAGWLVEKVTLIARRILAGGTGYKDKDYKAPAQPVSADTWDEWAHVPRQRPMFDDT